MDRAAVLIGVSRTGQLDELAAVQDGLGLMEKWAAAQDGMQVVRISDENDGEVTASAIKKAIKQLCEPGSLVQLLVYFAGHGVYRGGEYWLLSGAPEDPQEAVNVVGTVEIARRSGVSHVVIVADACRTAGSGVEFSSVTGSEIFPNWAPGRPPTGIDTIFACELGYESLEVGDHAAGQPRFRGIFSEVFADALNGMPGRLLERGTGDSEGYAFFHARKKWEDALSLLMADRLAQLGAPARYFQRPEIRAESEGMWISRLPWRDGLDAEEPAPGGGPAYQGEVSARDDIASRLGRLVRRESGADAAGMPGEDTIDEVFDDGVVVAVPRDPAGPGMGIVGAEAVSAIPAAPAAPATSVLVTLGDGTAVVLPGGEDLAVRAAFAPPETGELLRGWDLREVDRTAVEFRDFVLERVGERAEAAETDHLRALLAAAVRLGPTPISADAADVLAERVEGAPVGDAGLAILAASAFDWLGRRDLVERMRAATAERLGVELFDLALLSGALDGTAQSDRAHVVPCVPLLARNWSLLRARGVELGEASPLQTHLRTAVWTQFDAEGASLMARLITG